MRQFTLPDSYADTKLTQLAWGKQLDTKTRGLEDISPNLEDSKIQNQQFREFRGCRFGPEPSRQTLGIHQNLDPARYHLWRIVSEICTDKSATLSSDKVARFSFVTWQPLDPLLKVKLLVGYRYISH